MNERINIQDIVDILSERRGMDKKAAEVFVKEFFSLIEDALNRDRYVKIKGFGTFKLIEVERRESVNVNTGERIEIQEHTKVAFTPDNSLKELVNKPFSHFETIILNEGVAFDDMPFEGEENQIEELTITAENIEKESVVEDVVESSSVILPQEPVVEDMVAPLDEEIDEISSDDIEEKTINEPEEKEIEIWPKEEEGVADLHIDESLIEELVVEVPVVEEPLEEIRSIEEPINKESISEEPVVEEVQKEIVDKLELEMNQKVDNIGKRLQTEKMPFAEENDTYDKVFASAHDPLSMKYFMTIVIVVVLLCVAAIIFLYYPDLLNKIYQQPPVAEEQKEEQVEQPVSETPIADTISVLQTQIEPLADIVQEKESKVRQIEPEKKGDKEKVRIATLVVTPAPNAATAPVHPDSINYVIVGNHGTHVIGKGETLTKVALKYYGTKDLWPYLVKHNPKVIKNPNNVPFGTKINIPILEKKQ